MRRLGDESERMVGISDRGNFVHQRSSRGGPCRVWHQYAHRLEVLVARGISVLRGRKLEVKVEEDERA